MNKENLILAIKEKDNQFKKHGNQILVSLMVVVSIMLLLTFFYPFSSNEARDYTNLTFIIVYLVSMLTFGSFNEKRIYKKTHMICTNCNKLYDQGTLAIVVLENKCNHCNNKIYEE